MKLDKDILQAELERIEIRKIEILELLAIMGHEEIEQDLRELSGL